MKYLKLLPLLLAALLITAPSLFAQVDNSATVQHGPRFVDLNGDGFNDNAPDADGDGIPNGMDDDYVRPFDGTGTQNSWAYKRGYMYRTQNTVGTRFVDVDGDGICDNAGNANGLRRGYRMNAVNGQGTMSPGAGAGRAGSHGMGRGGRFSQ